MQEGTHQGTGTSRPLSIEDALTALIADEGLLAWIPTDGEPSTETGAVLDTLLFDGRQLMTLRGRLREGQGRADLRAAVRGLGVHALQDEPTFVTAKSNPGPSGDIHDYVSLARYWWPDPSRENGLPYVRRDGQSNPEGRQAEYDAERLARLSDSVLALAVCGYLLDDATWLSTAAGRLRGWLVDPQTRQNPSFDFAQQVRGRPRARSAAVIDARRILPMAEAFRILRALGVLTPDDEERMTAWFADLLTWLLDSEAARGAAASRNNVAGWCLLERAVLADLVDRPDVLSTALEQAGVLIASQVEADGSFPAELVRTNPADYTAFAFVALAMLAHVGEARGVGLWSRASGDGRALSATGAWLALVDPHRRATQTTVPAVNLALRLLSWREETYRHALARAEHLADTLGRRESQLERLTAQYEALHEQVSGATRRRVAGPRTLVEQARVWPVVGPAGRRIKRVVARAGRRGTGGRPPRPAVAHLDAVAATKPPTPKGPGDHDTFVLYRILGNDLPPRHGFDQTLENVRFILENEPLLEGCEKRWVLNRIADPVAEEALRDLLAQHEQPVLRLPFHLDDYATCPLEARWLASAADSRAAGTDRLAPRTAPVVAAFRLKNLYAMNNNAARNAAIEDGRGRATWVLPLDGSIFVTEGQWQRVRASVRDAPDLPYLVLPMRRVGTNAAVLEPGDIGPAEEEPQLAFRRDARERFDETRPYGRRPKVDLLWRLGVPGPWERWSRMPWDPPFPAAGADHGRFQVAGSVVRLASGGREESISGAAGLRDRGSARDVAIVDFLQGLDARVAEAAWAGGDLAFYDVDLVQDLADGQVEVGAAAVLAAAHAARTRDPEAVASAGIRLVAHDAASTALAWRITGDALFARHGGALVRAAVSGGLLGHPPGHGSSCSMSVLLDAVRLLRSAGVIATSEDALLAERLDRMLTAREVDVRDELAISAYLRRGRIFVEAALSAEIAMRRGLEDLARSSRRRSLAQWGLWLARATQIARSAESGGRDLWFEPDGSVGPLACGIDTYLGRVAATAEPAREPRGLDDGDAVLHAVVRRVREPGLTLLDLAADPDITTVPWVLGRGHDVAPFWPLAAGPTRGLVRRRVESATGAVR